MKIEEEDGEDFEIDDVDIIRIITNTLISSNEAIRDAIRILNKRFDEFDELFDARQIPIK